jgi:hypothetical protein
MDYCRHGRAGLSGLQMICSARLVKIPLTVWENWLGISGRLASDRLAP